MCADFVQRGMDWRPLGEWERFRITPEVGEPELCLGNSWVNKDTAKFATNLTMTISTKKYLQICIYKIKVNFLQMWL